MTAFRWQASRRAGLDRLADFLPCAGQDYARQRNYDTGPGERLHVSCLSPWIRHRLLLESEVKQAVLGEHTSERAEKFLQELFWRTYWKGWLEMRPAVWHDYRREVHQLTSQLEHDSDLQTDWRAATTGHTGIECFDHWVRELSTTGYLHNHARMWFASIWVFTLDLPWQLGADFFLRHLLDGDAAANTLSWRWVTGLQTPGKTYLASADNIARYTRGRFNPAGQLSTQATLPAMPEKMPPQPLPELTVPYADRCTGLLLTDEDLCAETLDLAEAKPHAVAAVSAASNRSCSPCSRPVIAFSKAAVQDGLQRAANHFGIEPSILPVDEIVNQALAWCDQYGLAQVIVPYAAVGPAQDMLAKVITALASQDIHVVPIRRAWDEILWPHATHGYFRFNKTITPLVRSQSIP